MVSVTKVPPYPQISSTSAALLVSAVGSDDSNQTSSSSDNSAQSGSVMLVLIVGIFLTLFFSVAGIIGNSLSIAVLCKVLRRGSKCPLFLILIALAASDSLVLAFTILLNVFGVGYEYWPASFSVYRVHGRLIFLFWPVTMAVQMTSVYLTVLVSYERWLAVCRPFHASNQCSLRRIAFIITFIVFGSFLYNAPRWLEYTTGEHPVETDKAARLYISEFCESDIEINKVTQTLFNASNANNLFLKKQTMASHDPNLFLNQLPHSQLSSQGLDVYTNLVNSECSNANIITYNTTSVKHNFFFRWFYSAVAYAIVVFFVPFVAITAMNIALVRSVRRSRKKWLNMSHSQRKEVKLSSVPLAIVGLFYVLGMPAVVTNVVESFRHPSNSIVWEACLTIANFCVVLNSAVNFILYCMLGGKFRHTLMNMCGCHGKSQPTASNLSRLHSAMNNTTRDTKTSDTVSTKKVPNNNSSFSNNANQSISSKNNSNNNLISQSADSDQINCKSENNSKIIEDTDINSLQSTTKANNFHSNSLSSKSNKDIFSTLPPSCNYHKSCLKKKDDISHFYKQESEEYHDVNESSDKQIGDGEGECKTPIMKRIAHEGYIRVPSEYLDFEDEEEMDGDWYNMPLSVSMIETETCIPLLGTKVQVAHKV